LEDQEKEIPLKKENIGVFVANFLEDPKQKYKLLEDQKNNFWK
jgi:hypothetical protein